MARFIRGWVIVSGSQPTAFRAREREDLLPTFKQLQRTQPDTRLMWYEHGRFWPSRDAADRARRERDAQRTRKSDWRPGGEHRDPKARPKVPRERRRELFRKRLVAKKTGSPRPGDKRRRGGDDS